MNDLRKQWLQLFESFENQSLVESMYEEIQKRYSEPHRAYHTLEHIEACLAHAKKVVFDDAFAVLIALCFHDVVYNPAAKDNEFQSALIAQAFLHNISCPPQAITKIVHLIESTAHPSSPQTQDEKYLLDIDLMILASSAKDYREYEKQIRFEYKHVPDEIFFEKRAKFLRSLLQCDRIYQSSHFQEKGEASARLNIKQSLNTKGSVD